MTAGNISGQRHHKSCPTPSHTHTLLYITAQQHTSSPCPHADSVHTHGMHGQHTQEINGKPLHPHPTSVVFASHHGQVLWIQQCRTAPLAACARLCSCMQHSTALPAYRNSAFGPSMNPHLSCQAYRSSSCCSRTRAVCAMISISLKMIQTHQHTPNLSNQQPSQ